MTIDMHAHWRPKALIEPLRARKTPPHIVKKPDGTEVLAGPRGEAPVSESFDDVDVRLAEMDRQGISTGALSLFGPFQWIERLPLAESLPLVQTYNNSVSEVCAQHEGRFVAFASLPLADMDAAVAEFERAMSLPGMIGAILPGNAFLTLKDAQAYRPLLAVANKHRCIAFVHWNPRPGDDWPRVKPGTDNMSPRIGTLDMQASLSANMMTLCFTDIMKDYPDAMVQVHNLGGNMPFEVERLDHRNLLDTPDQPTPSKVLTATKNVVVDCNSLGSRSIELGVYAYGADRIVFGTDGTEFGAQWSVKAVNDARIEQSEKRAIMHDNAARMISHLAPLADYRAAAE